jgi:hypothetical protein
MSGGVVTADEYLQGILNREAVDTGPYSPVRGVLGALVPIIEQWAGGMLIGVSPSGSFAKGTANRSGTDIDLFVSMSEQTSETLKEIYEKLWGRMKEKGLSPTRQNVSVHVKVSGYDVDLVPGKRQGSYGDDYSLYRRKADSWTKTNVVKHSAYVVAAGRQKETRVIKLWRDRTGLDFPSFYLELTVMATRALRDSLVAALLAFQPNPN